MGAAYDITVVISIHALHEESDRMIDQILTQLQTISIHALHEESDRKSHNQSSDGFLFQSTLSMRRATGGLCPLFVHIGISIHALHEESDSMNRQYLNDCV